MTMRLCLSWGIFVGIFFGVLVGFLVADTMLEQTFRRGVEIGGREAIREHEMNERRAADGLPPWHRDSP